MYEHLRNDFLSNLTGFSNAQTNEILTALDKAMWKYDIVPKETGVAIYEGFTPENVKLYLASKKLEGLSDRTIELYAGRLKIFFEYVNKKPTDVKPNDVRMFLVRYQTERKVSDRTLDKFRQVIHGFYRWLVDEEYTDKNPCGNIKNIKYVVEPRKSLSRMQLEQLRRKAKNPRDLAIIDTLYSTGCRVSELVNMRISQINSEAKSIEIIGKGKKHNTVYFNTNAQLSISAYLATRKDKTDYLFKSQRRDDKLTIRGVEGMFKALSEECGFFVTPHIMRHTSATLALQSGMDITTVQKMLGHASVATTQIYAEVAEHEVAEAHLKYVI